MFAEGIAPAEMGNQCSFSPKKYIRRMPTQNAGTAMTTSAEVFMAFPAALCLFTPEK